MMEYCPACNDAIGLAPYYSTKHGKVCEDCFESRKGEESEYQKFMKDGKND